MIDMAEPTYGTYEYAGLIAASWFSKLAPAFKQQTTLGCRMMEDQILDVALADAGVTPLDPDLPDPDFIPGQLHNIAV